MTIGSSIKSVALMDIYEFLNMANNETRKTLYEMMRINNNIMSLEEQLEELTKQFNTNDEVLRNQFIIP